MERRESLAVRVILKSGLAGNGERGTVKCHQVTALEDAQGSGDGLARGADEFADLTMGEWKAEVRATVGGLAILAPVEQQASEFLGLRVGQAHGAQLLAGHDIVAAQSVSGTQIKADADCRPKKTAS